MWRFNEFKKHDAIFKEHEDEYHLAMKQLIKDNNDHLAKVIEQKKLEITDKW